MTNTSPEQPGLPIQQTGISPVTDDCPVEVFRWGGQPDHHADERPHAHAFEEIMLINKGGGRHLINGIWHNIAPCSIHILPAGTAHHLLRTADCDGGTVVFLKEHVLREPFLPFKKVDFIQTAHPVLQLPPDVFSDVWLLYEQLLFECKKKQRFYRKPLILSWLNALFVKMAEVYSQHTGEEHSATSRHPAVTRFLELLEIHFRKERSVGFYARALCVSPPYLHELCVRELARGPQETIAFRAASEALALLSTGNISVKEVAFQLGFEDPAYFSRFLKKQTGKTPVEWLRN